MLTDDERELVKASAKRLLAHLHDKLVLDWRRKAADDGRRAHARSVDVLDEDLPEDPYPPEVFDAKVQAVFDHVLTAYGDDGTSVYDGEHVRDAPPWLLAVAPVHDQDLASITEAVVERIRTDAEFASLVAEQLGLPGGAALRTVEELIANDEDYAVEFKSTARWDLREGQAQQGDGGRRRQDGRGVPQHRRRHAAHRRRQPGTAVGLDHDYPRVKPTNGDGFVNWLTTHLINALGHTPVTRIRARIAILRGQGDLPRRRRRTHRTGVGEDEQGIPDLLRPNQQLHPRNPGG